MSTAKAQKSSATQTRQSIRDVPKDELDDPISSGDTASAPTQSPEEQFMLLNEQNLALT